MPVMDLRAECLRSPTRLDLSVISAFMLWPDDPEKRELAISSATAQFGAALIDTGKMPAIMLSDFARGAVDAPRHAEIQAMAVADRRFEDGILAGFVLMEAVHLHHGDDLAKAALANVLASLWKRNSRQNVSNSKTINNRVWKPLRSASPLWAAHLHLNHQDGNDAFPCRRMALPKFLALSEEYRRLGQTLRQPHATPILAADEAWCVSDKLKLPKVVFAFG